MPWNLLDVSLFVLRSRSYNLVALPLAAGLLKPSLGLSLTPALAALFMASSSTMVVVSSLGLKLYTRPGESTAFQNMVRRILRVCLCVCFRLSFIPFISPVCRCRTCFVTLPNALMLYVKIARFDRIVRFGKNCFNCFFFSSPCGS